MPRAVWRTLPREVFLPPDAGRDLERHLAGCGQVLALTATLGGEVDRLLRRFELTDIALSAAADALASACWNRSATRWRKNSALNCAKRGCT